MSLILDALKKVEKERGQPERGFLVMAHLPWAGGSRRRRWPWLLALAIGLAAVVWGWRSGHRGSASTPLQAAASPLPPPSGSAAHAVADAAIPVPPSEPQAASPQTTFGAPPRPTMSPRAPASGQQTASGSVVSGAAAGPKWPRLMAISVRDGRPVALLGERLVHEGDSFDGFDVLRIGTSEVEVRAETTRKVLRFE